MAQKAFDPQNHLSRIKGQEYLEVKWRIAWLRNEFRDAVIETDLVTHDAGRAIFKATVSLPNGGRATGFGSDTAKASPNYIEKAETKAIGRALAGLGFGTQFCTDFDDASPPPDQALATPPAERMTPAQRRRIDFAAGDLRLGQDQLDAISRQTVGKALNVLTRREASTLINALEARRAQPQPPVRLNEFVS